MTMLLIYALLYLCCGYCLGGDPYYAAEWSDVLRSCPDFENNRYKLEDTQLGSATGSDDEKGLLLTGNIELMEELTDDITMDLEVSKCTEFGDEPMYSAQENFCRSLKNKDVPWYPVGKKFNTTSCPVRKGQYSLDGMELSIEFAKDVINEKFIGEYEAKLIMMDGNRNKLSCHIASIAVVEKYKDI